MSSQCGFCGQEIKDGKENQKFCSMACRNKAIGLLRRSRRVPLICQNCGKEFHLAPSLVTRGRKCCSKACSVAYIKEHGRPDKKVTQRVCQNCGKEFTYPTCWLKKKNGRAGMYCSRACWNEYANKTDIKFGGRKPWTGKVRECPRSDGYITEYDEAHGRYVLQHRLVMERMLGRQLEKGEKVHHKNSDRTDNRPENLEIIIGHHFSGKRVKDAYTKDIERLALENLNLKRQLLELQEKLKE